ncbi:MAG: RNA ligase family protein [Deltaproteobacteria bacterium]|nr:RNA ligase family protein [Deltaproteobacteria bacterium]
MANPKFSEDTRVKYPRTRHLPWSPRASSDDVHLTTTRIFQNAEVVVTEKMDGENTTLYSDFSHARSLDGRHHDFRNWVKALQGRIGHQIPAGWRLCGENLFERHSISYEALPSYFLLFSIWNDDNLCLS